MTRHGAVKKARGEVVCRVTDDMMSSNSVDKAAHKMSWQKLQHLRNMPKIDTTIIGAVSMLEEQGFGSVRTTTNGNGNEGMSMLTWMLAVAHTWVWNCRLACIILLSYSI